MSLPGNRGFCCPTDHVEGFALSRIDHRGAEHLPWLAMQRVPGSDPRAGLVFAGGFMPDANRNGGLVMIGASMAKRLPIASR